ncbi:MAG: hypothetical protein ABL930_09555 [Pseudobdellovibrio sp.]
MSYLKFITSLFLVLFSTITSFAQTSEEAIDNNDKEYSGKQNQDWEKIQTKLGTMKSKLETQENIIKALIAEKLNLNGEALAVKMEQLKSEHYKFEKMVDEYNELNLQYLTKFPERGIKEKRIYTRMKSKSLQAFEDDQTLQGRVNKLQSKILTQYPKSTEQLKKKKKKPSDKSLDAKKNSIEPEVKKDKDVTDQIILKN